ncbi:MAG TPA: SGNH/GDSL hydrolase family protein [Thermoleophilaceae bacterium]
MSRRILALLVAAAALLVAPAAQAHAAHTGKAAKQYYLSLGDSYAVGYQGDVKKTTLNGFANQLVPLARRKGYRFTLVEQGCGGATTTSMLQQKGCNPLALAPGAANYPNQTQVQAAVAFIKRHKAQIGLVTVSIGGNDVDSCVSQPDPNACVANNMKGAVTNLESIVKQLRKAGGKKLRIVGTTYPDVVLGAWVRQDVFGTNAFTLATSSVTSFDKYINPGLQKAYKSVGAKFVDVTKATGAYGRFDTTTLAPYGTIPVPVAKVCQLTFFCTSLDIHMTTPGYGIIAKLVAGTLPKKR